MKTLKTILVATTALTFAETALADSNRADLNQIGNDNIISGSVTGSMTSLLSAR